MGVQEFRKSLTSETTALAELCGHFRGVLSSAQGISEDTCGDIMVAIGQAELLMKERFNQFSCLIDDCELKRGEKEVTCQDLQGFWDIIYFQVEDVFKRFDKLKILEKNGWKAPEPSPPLPPLPTQKPPVTKNVQNKENKKPAPNKAQKGCSTLRSLIKAARQKAKEEAASGQSPKAEESRFVIYTELKNPQQGAHERAEKAVFDAGFFKVVTPVKIQAIEKRRTPGTTEERVLASTLLREKRLQSPVIHKDYSPCMRVTRSMKARALNNKKLF